MTGGGRQSAACNNTLPSSAFRQGGYQDKCMHVYGEVTPGEGEVDHIIELAIVSKAFTFAFIDQDLETCLKVRSCTCNFFFFFLTNFIPCRPCVKSAQL